MSTKLALLSDLTDRKCSLLSMFEGLFTTAAALHVAQQLKWGDCNTNAPIMTHHAVQ